MQHSSITLKIRVVIEKDESNFFGYCPDLDGVLVQGETLENTKEFLRDTILVHIESMLKHNVPLPSSVIEEQQTENNVASMSQPISNSEFYSAETENLKLSFA